MSVWEGYATWADDLFHMVNQGIRSQQFLRFREPVVICENFLSMKTEIHDALSTNASLPQMTIFTTTSYAEFMKTIMR